MGCQSKSDADVQRFSSILLPLASEPTDPLASEPTDLLTLWALHFCQAEPVAEFECEPCAPHKTTVLKTHRLSPEHLPASLVFQLKRFAWSTASNKAIKVGTAVTFPSVLHASDLTMSRSPVVYALRAVLVHEGSSVSHGHSFTFRRHSDGTWWKCDDTAVTA